MRDKIEALRQQLKTGITIATSPTLYPTPNWLAEKMVELSEFNENDTFLEPSAGIGSIIDKVPSKMGTMIEIDYNLSKALNAKYSHLININQDFLTVNPETIGLFNIILMNPPFNNAADIKHILHALNFLKNNGKLIAICSNGPRQNDQLKPLADYWEVLPEKTFKNAGTNVNTVLLKLTKKT